jgi:hypothetical protein
VFPLEFHVLLPLVVHCESRIAEHLLHLCDLVLFGDQFTLLEVHSLQDNAQTLCLLLPLNSLTLKGVYIKRIKFIVGLLSLCR